MVDIIDAKTYYHTLYITLRVVIFKPLIIERTDKIGMRSMKLVIYLTH